MALKIIIGTTTEFEADAIVNVVDDGLSSDIFKVGGNELIQEYKSKSQNKISKVVVTKNHNLPCKHIMHVLPPKYGQESDNHMLAQCYKDIFNTAVKLKCKSIVIPIISSKNPPFPTYKAIKVAFNRIEHEYRLNKIDILIIFVVPDVETLEIANKLYEKIFAKSINDDIVLAKVRKVKCPICGETYLENQHCQGCETPMTILKLIMNHNEKDAVRDLIKICRENYWHSLKEFEINETSLVKYRGFDSKIKVPYGITTIGKSAFEESSVKSVNLPETVVNLDSYAFYNSELKNINLPEGMRFIGEHALSETNIYSLNIPSSVEHIDITAFQNSVNLKFVSVDEKNVNYRKENGDIFCNKNNIMIFSLPKQEKIEEKLLGEDTLYIYNGNISCHKNKHKIIQATGVIYTLKNERVKINIEYCEQCKKYILEYGLYEEYRNRYGVIIGNFRLVKNGQFNNKIELAEESPLKLSGYSVSQKDAFTKEEREYILARIIYEGIMDKGTVIKYLSHFISMNGEKAGNEIALKKWRSDLFFAQNYNIDIQPHIIISNVKGNKKS